jgi:hypothetical protein
LAAFPGAYAALGGRPEFRKRTLPEFEDDLHSVERVESIIGPMRQIRENQPISGRKQLPPERKQLRDR